MDYSIPAPNFAITYSLPDEHGRVSFDIEFDDDTAPFLGVRIPRVKSPQELQRYVASQLALREKLTRHAALCGPYYDLAEILDTNSDPISAAHDLLTNPHDDLPPACTVMTDREAADLARYFLNSVHGLGLEVEPSVIVACDVEPTLPHTDSDKPPRNLRRIDFSTPYDLNAPDPLIDGILPASGVGILYGESNIGKSFVALNMAHAIASGRPWGERETQQGAVLYVAAEGSADSIAKRCEALRRHYGAADIPLRFLQGSVSLASNSQADTEIIVAEAQALTTESGQPIKLVVVDTLSACMPGTDENSAKDAGAIVWRLSQISQALGCTVVGVHHTGKNKDNGPRGSYVFTANVDFKLEVRGTGEGFGEIISEKQRDEAKERPIKFRLNVVQLGVTRSGRPVSSCVAEVVTDGQKDFGVSVDISPDAAEALAALEQVQQALAENDSVNDWRSVPVSWRAWCESYHSAKAKTKVPDWGKLKKSRLVERLSQLRSNLVSANRVWLVMPSNPTDPRQYRTGNPDKPPVASGVDVFN